MSSRGQILILIIVSTLRDLVTTLLSSWTHIFDSPICISVLNISKVPQTHHSQTLFSFSFSKKLFLLHLHMNSVPCTQ